jgi:hypothetical protein
MRGTFFSLQAVHHGEGLAIVPYSFDGSVFEVTIVAHPVLFSLELLAGILLHEILLSGRAANRYRCRIGRPGES